MGSRHWETSLLSFFPNTVYETVKFSPALANDTILPDRTIRVQQDPHWRYGRAASPS
jgi:hypothetical protein